MYMVYDFRTGTIRPLDAISRTFFFTWSDFKESKNNEE